MEIIDGSIFILSHIDLSSAISFVNSFSNLATVGFKYIKRSSIITESMGESLGLSSVTKIICLKYKCNNHVD